MGPVLAPILLVAFVVGLGVVLRLRRNRAEELLTELREALSLAAEAQQVHWRLQRRYSSDLAELARLRRAPGPLVDGSRHGGLTQWQLGASEDGSRFELAISTRRHDLLKAQGVGGTIAYDSLAA